MPYPCYMTYFYISYVLYVELIIETIKGNLHKRKENFKRLNVKTYARQFDNITRSFTRILRKFI